MIIRAILNDKFTITKEINLDKHHNWKQDIIDELIKLSEIKVKYNSTVRATVYFYKMIVKNNTATWEFYCEDYGYFPNLRISQEDFEEEQEKDLEGIPACY